MEEQSEMIEKVKQLEKVVHAMTQKVLSLEEEIMKIKKNTTKNEIVKELRNLKGVKEKCSEVNADMSEQNCFNPTISSSPKVENTISNKNMKKDKEQKSEIKEDLYSCSMCEYKAKKEAT
jgi:hypothetical protein